MKKFVIILACMLFCLSLISGCTDDKDSSNSDTDLGGVVELDIDAEGKGDAGVSSDDNGIVYEFKDPEKADGILVAPKE